MLTGECQGYKLFNDYYAWRILVFRLFNVILASTWFVPDENFQSVEVAFNIVYGRGFLTWEWNTDKALRSAVHPIIYALLFYALKAAGLDFNIVINWAPNILHAILFVIADICYLKFLGQLFGHRNFEMIKTTFLFYATNWFLMYCSTRTLSNTLETALTIMALNWYQKVQSFQIQQDKKFEEKLYAQTTFWSYHCVYMLCAAWAVVVRPTAVLIWLPLYFINFFESSHKLDNLIRCAIPCGALTLFVSFTVDWLYYGLPTLCLWNFAKFNLLQGGSAHFGANIWFWYFVNGFPSIFTLLCLPLCSLLAKKLWVTPTILTGNFCQKELPGRYFWTSLFYVAIHSLIAHKEHRFLLPVIPLVMPYLVVEMNDLLNALVHLGIPSKVMTSVKSVINVSMVILNVSMALYFGLVHQRGPHAAVNYVFNNILEANPDTSVQILQLMPCFSMPQHSSLHPYSVHIRMLDCTVVLKTGDHQIDQQLMHGQVEDYREEGEEVVDEADSFHNDPLGWIRENWQLVQPDASKGIGVIIAYEKTYKQIQTFLDKKGYKVVKSVFHSHFLTSSNQDSRILISVNLYE